VSIVIPAFDGMEAMTRFTLAGVRPMAMLALLPGLGGVALPWRARAAVAASLASFTAFGPHAPPLTFAMLPGEVLAGLLAGMAIALAFAAAQMAGEVAAQIIGLGFASVPGAGGNVSVIGGFFGMLLWAAFLSGDGFLWLFASVAAGQGVLPPGSADVATLAAYGGVMFAGALRMALPVVGLLLLGNLLVAVAARSAPQLGALAIGPAALLLAFVWALPMLFEALISRATMTLNAAQGLTDLRLL
jgi:flagellar biosynthetic protein FliR